jgi:hypothetical protein
MATFGTFLGITALGEGLLALFPSVWELRASEFSRRVDAGKSG